MKSSAQGTDTRTMGRWASLVGAAIVLCIFPFVASQFWVVGIAIHAMVLGTIALSLNFLAAQVGMVSLAQTAVAGVAGYVLANLTVERGWSPWPAVLAGVATAVVFCVAAMLVAGRSYGIYFLMITLSLAVLVYYTALQYRPFTNGFSGINGVGAPSAFGIDLTTATHFYFLALVIAAGSYLLLSRVSGSPFGLTLRGIRDGKSRMCALGFRITIHRTIAFAVAGLVAAIGGVLSVWYNGQISPGSIDLTRTIDILVISVIGGMYRLHGAWVGAFAIAILDAYANQVTTDVNSLIGAVFVVVLLVSPAGLVGIVSMLRARVGRRRPRVRPT